MKGGITDRVRPILDSVRIHAPGEREVNSDVDHLNGALNWIRRSQDVTQTGGSAATYNLILDWEDPYPETSGYIIPTLFKYADFFDDDEVRQRAVDMAEWVLSTQHDGGSFPGGAGETGDPNAFNTGQIILGLVEAYDRTGEAKYRESVRKACDWLVDAQSDEGHWAEHDYKGEPHAYTSRISWPILVGAEVVEGETDQYREAARNNLEWIMDNQRPNGWFENVRFESDADAFLHTIAYTIRGLIEAGILLEDEAVIQSGKRAADELLAIQTEDGVLKGSYDETWNSSWYYCLTGNAQMAIVWIRLYELTGNEEYLDAARTSVQFLKRRQLLDSSPDIQGGIPGSYPIFGKYLYLRYPNWATKFFMDAILGLLEVDGEVRGQTTMSGQNVRKESRPLQM